jgi:hypothetical protein
MALQTLEGKWAALFPSTHPGQESSFQSPGVLDEPHPLPRTFSAHPAHSVVQLLTGMQQSVRPGDGGITVNVDVAHTTVYEPAPLPRFLATCLGMRDPRGLDRLFHTQHMQAKTLLMHKEVNPKPSADSRTKSCLFSTPIFRELQELCLPTHNQQNRPPFCFLLQHYAKPQRLVTSWYIFPSYLMQR